MFNNSHFDLEKWAAQVPATQPAKVPAHTTKQASNNTRPATPDNSPVPAPDDLRRQVQAVADELIARSIDITADYPSWLNLGFALANGLGEEGRPLFHQLSSLYPAYDAAECSRKYDSCLHDNRGSITIATFFHMAKQAGVDLSMVLPNHHDCDNNDNVPTNTSTQKHPILSKNAIWEKCDTAGTMSQLAQLSSTSTFSDKIPRQDLPSFFHPILDNHDSAHYRDMMILGTLNIISGILPTKLLGIYDRRTVYAPLYTIVWGSFASGKGFLELCKHIVMPIKERYRKIYDNQMQDYEQELAHWEANENTSRGPKPEKPSLVNPFLSANSSASAFCRDLDANGGWGLMFETEADTLTIMLSKSEYGDYSDILRKAHHHETISMRRVTDNVDIEISEPRLSAFLTCTGSQLPLLLPSSNVANGLASRFLFYQLPGGNVSFRNVFENSSLPLEQVYRSMGERFLPLYEELAFVHQEHIQFILSNEQQNHFLHSFDNILHEQFSALGDGIQGFIYRMALETFRIAMVLSVLRRLSEWNQVDTIFQPEETALNCDSRDFNTAMTITQCLLDHTGCIYNILCANVDDPFKNAVKTPSKDLVALFKALPEEGEFRTKDAVEIAVSLGIQERTAKRYLNQLQTVFHLLEHDHHGTYRKVQPQNPQS